MSQFFQGVTAGGLPPSVPTSFTTDNSTVAIPSANNINVFTPGNGTQGIATSASGSTITITLIDTFLSGTAQTVNAGNATFTSVVPVPISNSVVNIRANIAGYAKSSEIAIGAELIGAVRNVGAVLQIIQDVEVTRNNDASLAAWSATFTTSGTNVLIQVTGVAGFTINWTAIIDYVTATEAQA